jgi:hypothetical protein
MDQIKSAAHIQAQLLQHFPRSLCVQEFAEVAVGQFHDQERRLMPRVRLDAVPKELDDVSVFVNPVVSQRRNFQQHVVDLRSVFRGSQIDHLGS